MKLFHKALLYQNYKQTKIVVWIMLLLFLFAIPIQALFAIESWESQIQNSGAEPYFYTFKLSHWDVYSVFAQTEFQFIIAFALTFFACLLIGVERNTRRMDFTFSLPFSRKDLFMTKWMYGVLLILIFHSISFILAYWILNQSQFAYGLSFVNMNEIYFSPIVGFLVIFSFALFIGTITGEMISQFALTWIFSFFPFGFFYLIVTLLDIHFITSFRLPEWVLRLNMGYYLMEHSNLMDTIYGILATILFVVIGVMLYEKNKVEHNGEFLIFKQLHPIFLLGITISFSLFGGAIISAFAPWNAYGLRIVAYWIGFVVFFLFSFIITRRLLNMNVIVKNK